MSTKKQNPKMFDIATIAVDPVKTKEGVWVTFANTDAMFLITRYQTKEAEFARTQKLAQMYKELKEDDTQALAERIAKIDAEVMASHVLLDWKNIGYKGKEIPFSKETALVLLSKPEFESIFQFIFQESIAYSNFASEQEDLIVTDVKTSASS